MTISSSTGNGWMVLQQWLYPIIRPYLLAELTFFCYVYMVMIPCVHRARRRSQVSPRLIRDQRFQKEPHKMLQKLLRRMKSYDELRDRAPNQWKSARDRFQDLVAMYFLQRPLPKTDDTDSNKGNVPKQPSNIFKNLYKEGNFNEFLSWAFFNKNYDEMTELELSGLTKCKEALSSFFNFQPLPGKSMLDTIRLNIDNPIIIHRPLIFYAVIFIIRLIASLWLKLNGFQYCSSNNGISYWYHPGNYRRPHSGIQPQIKDDCSNPILFLHGIAPAGYVVYLPFFMHYWNRLNNSTSPVFVFDIPYISMTLTLNVLTEDEVTEDMLQAINDQCKTSADTNGDSAKVSLVCHSFGTFLASWFAHSAPHRICSLTLLDPVSVMLHATGVGQNFNFSYHWTEAFTSISKLTTFLVATTELGVQNFLRGHFCWYNSELFLEDLNLEDMDVLIWLSMRDDIMDSSVVKDEVHRLNLLLKGENRISMLCKEDMKHGDFLFNKASWNEIVNAKIVM